MCPVERGQRAARPRAHDRGGARRFAQPVPYPLELRRETGSQSPQPRHVGPVVQPLGQQHAASLFEQGERASRVPRLDRQCGRVTRQALADLQPRLLVRAREAARRHQGQEADGVRTPLQPLRTVPAVRRGHAPGAGGPDPDAEMRVRGARAGTGEAGHLRQVHRFPERRPRQPYRRQQHLRDAVQPVAVGGRRKGVQRRGLRVPERPQGSRPGALLRQVRADHPGGGEFLQGVRTRRMARPEPGDRVFEDPPGLVRESRIRLQERPVDQQGAQVDPGQVGAAAVALRYGHRRPQQYGGLIGGGRVAHGLVPAAQRLREVVEVQRPFHRRRRAVVQRAAEHRHRLGQPGPAAGGQPPVHEGAAQVGERHPGPQPGRPVDRLAQCGDGPVPECLVPAPDGPEPPDEAESGEDGTAKAVRHRSRRGQCGFVVALRLVRVPRVTAAVVQRPQAVAEAEQGPGRGRSRRHGDRLPVAAHGLLQ